MSPPFYNLHAGVDHSTMDHSGMDMSGETSMAGNHMAGMKMYIHGSIGQDTLWFASWVPSGAGATVGVCIGLFVLGLLDRYIHALHRACVASWSRGKVGFAMPVASGYLRDKESELGTSTGSTTATATIPPADRRAGSTKEKSSLELVPPPPPQAGACACGCGGECGGPSAPPCGGNCAPEYERVEGEKTGASLAPPSRAPSRLSVNSVAASLSHLPAAVQRSLDPQRGRRWSRPFDWRVDVPRALLFTFVTILHFLIMLVIMTYQLWWIISVLVGMGVGEALFGRFGAPASGSI